MDVRIQQRLVGGLVILALIFLIAPVVLDGEGRLPEKITQIPPKPKRPDLSHLNIEPVNPESTTDTLPQTPPAPVVSVVETQPQQPVAATPEPQTPVTAATPTPTASPEQRAAVAAGERAWSVQVASFRDSAKAAALRDQLREAGFTTYVNEVILSDGSLFTQVLVGPETDMDAVQALKSDIKEKVALQGLVVRYEP
ncbi:SPOR domain-containing protein [Saccharospirillum mangrovi]|uniref:SPOR domain-containing protein n=1 Tax=Saccharospirillum mangrovi TaxID=2161747 RepID=UPI0013006F79|nr:SPOR domain-containing protein [Saccharospirillum mangrovi]